MKIFVCEKYGMKREFHEGQKVECTYYHESIQLSETPSVNPLRYFQPFKPVKLGIIVGGAGLRPYYLAPSGKGGFGGLEQYLYVKFKEYFFAKAIPISCIQDAKRAAETMRKMLDESKHKIGEPGYDLESFTKISLMTLRAENFIKD